MSIKSRATAFFSAFSAFSTFPSVFHWIVHSVRFWVLIATLALSTVLSLLLQQPTPIVTRPPAEITLWNTIDFSIHDFTLNSFSPTGILSHQLKADKLIQHTDHSITIDQPTLLWQNWQAKADIGLVKKRKPTAQNNTLQEQVTLKSNVILSQLPQHTDAEPTMTIHSEHMAFWPDLSLAKTPEPVIIRDHTATVTGTGLEAKLADRSIILKQQVKSVYETNHITQ